MEEFQQHHDSCESPSSMKEGLRADQLFEPEGLRELVQRHTLPVIQQFCNEEESLLQRNDLILWVGESPELRDRRYVVEHTQLVKPVIFIESHAYCFLDASDRKQVWEMPRNQQQLVWQRFGGAMIRILHPRLGNDTAMEVENNKPRRIKRESLDTLVQYDHSRELKRARRTDESITALSVELALAKQENENQKERHRIETELMQTRHELALKSKDNEVLSAQLALTQQQQYFTQLYQQYPPSQHRSQLALTGPQMIRKVTSVQEWLKDSHYQQDFSQIPLPKEVRYQNVFNDQRVRYNDLLQSLHVVATSQGRLLLVVPLTYRYKLVDILQCLTQSQQGAAYRNEIGQLLRCCPSSYTVQLHWINLNVGPDGNEDAEAASRSIYNELNVSIILVHCQAITLAYDLNRPAKDLAKQVKTSGTTTTTKKVTETQVKEKELLQIQVIVHHPNEFVPALGPLDEFYPHCAFYGPGTFITPSMGLRLRNPSFKKDKNKKNGTGSGKLCPLCWTMDRVYTLTAGTEAQHTHSICSCPQLAMLSDNEAQILLAIRHACTPWRGNEERAAKLRGKKFLFGKNFSLGEKAFFRRATPEEIAQGDHVGELRVNATRRMELCQTVFTLLKVQLKRSPLLGPLHRRLHFLANLLLTTPGLDHNSTVSQLLIDADGKAFKLKTRSFDCKDGQDRLFFSLKTPLMTPREAFYYQDCQVQQQTQLLFTQSLYQQQHFPVVSDLQLNEF